jgi:hypothetical protein
MNWKSDCDDALPFPGSLEPMRAQPMAADKRGQPEATVASAVGMIDAHGVF